MLPKEIIAKIPSSYDKALESGDLFFFPSTVHKHAEGGVEYEIRHCPALLKKPVLPTPHFDTEHRSEAFPADASATTQAEKPKDKKPDPFEPPYIPNLFIGELNNAYEDQEEEYAVLLNKYSVVPHHFLLVTKEFRSQTSPLTPDDLVTTYLLLIAAHKARRDLFAFYNCGDLSGASQHHKHVQFVYLDDEDGPPIEVLARAATLETASRPFSLSALPYANHIYRFPARFSSFPPEKIEPIIAQAFMSLLDLVISTVRHDPSYPAGVPSYNVLITLEHMHLIPRRKENHTLEVTGEELSVNALGYAGMLLVKSEKELDAVKNEGVGKILRDVGLESVHDIQVAGTCGEADADDGSSL